MNFSKTINLPKTNFSMKANLSATENNWIEFWKKKKIYWEIKNKSSKSLKYILHDGPPYANGDLHLGHALNKILKDIICRIKFLENYNVDYVPGWDCHGLPIEWKIEEEFKKKGLEKSKIELDVFRDRCREFASHWVSEQKKQFMRFGLLTDWQHIYLTMNKESQLKIVNELLTFFESGGLYLGFKPVMWSVIEQTALAEAEIEYYEKTSKSIYVKFPILSKNNTAIVIWTTTPWTIPCNRAIAYSKKLQYKTLRFTEKINELNINKNESIILASALVEDFISKHKIEKFEIVNDISHVELEKLVCDHPLKEKGFENPIKVYPSDHVTDDAGTGFVHIAPNHGLEDFEVGKKFNLGNDPTVDSKGIYEKEIKVFGGTHIFKADDLVINELNTVSNLISSNEYKHSYPHSWRSKAPLIFRATSQWFISMDENDLRKKTLGALDNVEWIPKNSRNRISSMIKERPDWCVSRQRNWGVPITIFINKDSQKPLLDKEVNKKIISILEKHGVDSWFKLDNKEFLTKNYEPDKYIKVTSILDVWFDSGASHSYVLKDRGIECADLYLEGTDQHRGWFQTSLIESCGIYNKSPYKAVLTHGFVIDEKGKKMSKSLGNIISPKEVIDKYGADILRIWVANSNFTEDVRISFENLDRHSESYRKIRNSLRFLLGNLNGWDVKNSIEFKSLPQLEKYILHRLFKVHKEVREMYKEYNFSKAFQNILSFCNNELSSFFFDIRKDNLYCDNADSNIVNSTKTVMRILFINLIRLISPITPFTSEEAWQSWRSEIDGDAEPSCHLLKYEDLPTEWENNKIENDWSKVLEIRNAFLFFLEKQRNLKIVKSSMESNVSFYFKDKNLNKIANSLNLSEILISSLTNISGSLNDKFEEYPDNKNIHVKIEKSNGKKCPRCWKIFLKEKEDQELCNRCTQVVDKII